MDVTDLETSVEASEEAAFRELLSHRTMLKAYIRMIVQDPILAEDTFSEVTLRILRAWNTYDKNRPFALWARGVARRVAFDSLRRRSHQPILLDTEALERIAEELDSLGNEGQIEIRTEALRKCMQRLPRSTRQLVELHYFEEKSYQEIAEFAGKSIGAIYTIFSRMHSVLRQCIERQITSL
jgi:RNA polymerase sigma-70 factor (ECF subfamily)